VEGTWLILIGFFLRSMAYTAMEGFSISHSLGEVTVFSAMNRNLVGVAPDIPVDRLVSEYVRIHPHSEFPVQENDRFIGTVSLEEIANLTEEERRRANVRDIMVPLVAESGISPETSLAEAFRRMKNLGISRLLVFEDGKVAGILNRKGVIRLLELRRARDLPV
jgi:predicted transcriptional regulator